MVRAFAPRGPWTRSHTSLGQRPRLPDGIISEGLKARSIGLPWGVPTGAQGIGGAVTWADGPGWYRARRWR
jgi:hypothetical protein